MEPIVSDALQFYRRELEEGENPATSFLRDNGLLQPALLERLSLGYASGKLKEVAGPHQVSSLKRIGLMGRERERFHNCLVIPIRDRNGSVADIFGYRLRSTDIRPVIWKTPLRGMLGGEVIGEYEDIVLCEIPLHYLKCVSLGIVNAVAMRSVNEAGSIINKCAKHGVKQIYYMGIRKRNDIFPLIKKAGIRVKPVAVNEEGEHHGVEYLSDLPAPKRLSAIAITKETTEHIFFKASDTEYRVESGLKLSPCRNSCLRVAKENLHFIDRLDLTSSASRSRFARLVASKLRIPAITTEEHLSQIADMIDKLRHEQSKQNSAEFYEPDKNTKKEALSLLRTQPDILGWFSSVLKDGMGYAGEETAKRLSILIATSRLLNAPTGGCLRGPSGCGKSTLTYAVAGMLPASQVLLFSRLSPQSLYFLPREQLLNRLLVVDEYEGLEPAEYAIRTLMSSQTLAMASTIKDGGSLPVTKTVNIPARLAVLVTTTGRINAENLSRFVEITLDSSEQQNRRVLRQMAEGINNPEVVEIAKAANSLLKPCTVEVPFASSLSMGGSNVRMRRVFSRMLTLLKAHAALNQFKRERVKKDGKLIVTATTEDYKAVFPLLNSLHEHNEEEMTPAGMKLLGFLRDTAKEQITREEVMRGLDWSYSRAYRTLKELTRLELLQPDSEKNGVKRVYSVTNLTGFDTDNSLISPEHIVSV